MKPHTISTTPPTMLSSQAKTVVGHQYDSSTVQKPNADEASTARRGTRWETLPRALGPWPRTVSE